MMTEDCLKHKILSAVSSIYDAALENNAASLELTIKAERGHATYEVYMSGQCKAKNGDLSD